MENLNKISKAILYLVVISFVLFTGSYLVKLGLFYQLFEPKNLDLKDVFQNSDLTLVLSSLLPSLTITLLSYAAFLFSLITFLLISKISLKNNGWLFIITMIVAVTGIFELILLFNFDRVIIHQLFSSTLDQEYVISLLKGRMTEFGPFPLILLFSYLVIIFLALFRPLTKRHED